MTTRLCGPTAYVRWAALLTIFLYTIGYAAIGFGLLFFGALWHLISRRSVFWRTSPLDLPLAIFSAVLLIAAAVSPYHRLALGVTLMLLISGAVYFGSFGWLLAHDPESGRPLLRTWALGAVVGALAGLAYSATNFVAAGPLGAFIHARAQIPRGVGPNGLGTTLLLGSIVALGLAFHARRWERAGWAACGLLSLVGLLATGSRSSLVGWVVGAGYLAYRELHVRPKRLAAVLAGGLVVLILASAATPQLMRRLRYTAEDVSSNRILIWRTSLGMIRAHPLLGTGFGTFEREYERHKSPGMSPEPFAFNLPLNLAVETGLLGLLAALSVAITAVYACRSGGPGASPSLHPFRGLIGALWVGLLVDQFADNTLFSISTSAGLWLLLAMTAVPSSHAALREGTQRHG